MELVIEVIFAFSPKEIMIIAKHNDIKIKGHCFIPCNSKKRNLIRAKLIASTPTDSSTIFFVLFASVIPITFSTNCRFCDLFVYYIRSSYSYIERLKSAFDTVLHTPSIYFPSYRMISSRSRSTSISVSIQSHSNTTDMARDSASSESSSLVIHRQVSCPMASL